MKLSNDKLINDEWCVTSEVLTSCLLLVLLVLKSHLNTFVLKSVSRVWETISTEKPKFRCSAYFHGKTTNSAAWLKIQSVVATYLLGSATPVLLACGYFYLTNFCCSVWWCWELRHKSWLFLPFCQETVLCNDAGNFRAQISWSFLIVCLGNSFRHYPRRHR